MMKFSPSIAAGLGSINSLGEVLPELFIHKDVILVSGETSFKMFGEGVKKSLESHDFHVHEIVSQFTPDMSGIENLKARVVKAGVEKYPLIALGGGIIIDLCKYIASELDRHLIVIPTLLSSDAIASGYSVIWDGTTNRAVRTKSPNMIIGDYDILKRQPKKYISAGMGDMLSKVSALFDWRLSFWMGGESYNDFAMTVARSTTELLQRRIIDVSKMNYIGIETLFLSEVTDGYLMELAGSTRVAAGSEHLFTFALESLEPGGLHGIYCGLGTIMMSYLQSRENLDIRGYLQAGGLPTNIQEAGISRENVVRALTVAHKMRPWYTILGLNGLSEGSAERLARYTQIIE